MKQETMNLHEQTHIREFINHLCDGELAKANGSLREAVKTKVKTAISSILEGE